MSTLSTKITILVIFGVLCVYIHHFGDYGAIQKRNRKFWRLTMHTANSWMEKDPIRKAHLVRLERLGAALDNWESMAADAADRLCEGRAAFWTTTKQDDFTGGVCHLANMHGDLKQSCDDKQIWGRKTPAQIAVMLDRLIPLNEPAQRQIVKLYTKVGTFRDEAEIANRAYVTGVDA